MSQAECLDAIPIHVSDVLDNVDAQWQQHAQAGAVAQQSGDTPAYYDRVRAQAVLFIRLPRILCETVGESLRRTHREIFEQAEHWANEARGGLCAMEQNPDSAHLITSLNSDIEGIGCSALAFLARRYRPESNNA